MAISRGCLGRLNPIVARDVGDAAMTLPNHTDDYERLCREIEMLRSRLDGLEAANESPAVPATSFAVKRPHPAHPDRWSWRELVIRRTQEAD